MNTYVHKWRLAVAMKQPYPRPETGAEDSTATAGAPPVFIPVEKPTSQEVPIRVFYAGLGAFVGLGAAYLILSK